MDETAGTYRQKQVNGAYRLVQLLTAVAFELDPDGAYISTIQGIVQDFADREAAAEDAQDQLVNGFYRSVELAAIIAYELG
jgi:hypothetical protein